MKNKTLCQYAKGANMEVKLKLHFADGQQLRDTIRLLESIPCPCAGVNCGVCSYYDSCKGLLDIRETLKEVVIYEE